MRINTDLLRGIAPTENGFRLDSNRSNPVPWPRISSPVSRRKRHSRAQFILEMRRRAKKNSRVHPSWKGLRMWRQCLFRKRPSPEDGLHGKHGHPSMTLCVERQRRKNGLSPKQVSDRMSRPPQSLHRRPSLPKRDSTSAWNRTMWARTRSSGDSVSLAISGVKSMPKFVPVVTSTPCEAW